MIIFSINVNYVCQILSKNFAPYICVEMQFQTIKEYTIKQILLP